MVCFSFQHWFLFYRNGQKEGGKKEERMRQQIIINQSLLTSFQPFLYTVCLNNTNTVTEVWFAFFIS